MLNRGFYSYRPVKINACPSPGTLICSHFVSRRASLAAQRGDSVNAASVAALPPVPFERVRLNRFELNRNGISLLKSASKCEKRGLEVRACRAFGRAAGFVCGVDGFWRCNQQKIVPQTGQL